MLLGKEETYPVLILLQSVKSAGKHIDTFKNIMRFEIVACGVCCIATFVVFDGWTHMINREITIQHDGVFGGFIHHNRVVVGVGECDANDDDFVDLDSN